MPCAHSYLRLRNERLGKNAIEDWTRALSESFRTWTEKDAPQRRGDRRGLFGRSFASLLRIHMSQASGLLWSRKC